MEPAMILSILEHTPVWVWAVFCAVSALGLAQTRTRNVGRARAILLPVVMVGLSLSGTFNTFTQVPLALAAWTAGFALALSFAGAAMAVRGASWSPATRRFQVPGSWLPVALILGIFVTKYVAGACLATNPSLSTNTSLTWLLSLLYGTFAGLFWARARSLVNLTRSGRTVQPA
ncbi:MAG: DUF6622 family protein [Steroidobacteraceae bacterium]